MDIILLKDIDNVGEKFSLVTVKPGYARNYLIPRKMALVANDTNRRKLNELKRRESAQEGKVIAYAEEVAAKLADKILKIGSKAGTSGKIFGSVTNIQLSNSLKEQFDIDIDRKNIEIAEEVKSLGTYYANLNIHKSVEVKVNFEVIEE